MTWVRRPCLLPVLIVLAKVKFYMLEIQDVVKCPSSLLPFDMCLSRTCHNFGFGIFVSFNDLSWFIIVSGNKWLDFTRWQISMLRFDMHHDDTLDVILYPSLCIMSIEIKLHVILGTCCTWCKMIVLPFGNWMGTYLILAIAHSYPLSSWIVPLVLAE